MSVKRYTDAQWKIVETRKQYAGGQWVALDKGWRADGEGAFSQVWDSTQTYTYTTGLGRAYYYRADYRNTDFDSMDYFYQGGQPTGQKYSELLFVGIVGYAERLADASNVTIEAYFERDTLSHGEPLARLQLYYSTSLTSAPLYWSGSGILPAVDVWPTFARGEGKWVTLKPEVGEALRSGTLTCLALSVHTSCPAESFFAVVRNSIKLRATYTV